MKKIFLFIVIIFIANIVAAQNVGVGTTTPTEKLHVDSGSIKIGKLVWNATNLPQFLKFGDGDFIGIGEEEADDRLLIKAKNIIFKPTASYNGYVGINTPYAPTSPLEIFTPINASLRGLRLTQAGPGFLGSYDGSWNIHCSTDDGIFSNYLYFDLFATNKAFISGFDGSYHSVSDRKCKKGIHYLKDSILLPKIMQLKPASYFMKEDTVNAYRRWGFISQDVETIFPEVVTTTRNIKMMNYSGLIPILTKGIQEQQQQIEILQKENATIQKELQELRKMILTKN
jgi:Chaperone of endosialidase